MNKNTSLLCIVLISTLLAESSQRYIGLGIGDEATMIVAGDDARSVVHNPALLPSIGDKREVQLLFKRENNVTDMWDMEDDEKQYRHTLSLFYPKFRKGVDLALQFRRERLEWYGWYVTSDLYKRNIWSISLAATLDSLIHVGVSLNRYSAGGEYDSFSELGDGSECLVNMGVLAEKKFKLPNNLTLTPRVATTLNNIGRRVMKNYFQIEPERYCNIGSGLGFNWSNWFSFSHNAELHLHLNGEDQYHNSKAFLSQNIGITPFFSVENVYRYTLNEGRWAHQNNPRKSSSFAVGFNLHKWYRLLHRSEKISRFNVDLQFKRCKMGSFLENKDDDGAFYNENQFSVGVAFLPLNNYSKKRNWISVGEREELEGDLVE